MQAHTIHDVIRNVHRVEYATNRIVDSLFYGAYKSVFRGRGIEFSEVRKYRLGDDVRAIDWNVSARMGELYVKEYVEERDLTLVVAFDCSGSFDFGTQTALKKTIAVELAASLFLSAAKNNDQAGLLLFSEEVEKFIPPAKGRKNTLALIRHMLYHNATSRKTDMSAPLSFLAKTLTKRSIIFVVSDFEENAQEYLRQLTLLKQRHDVICVRITDPREQSMPDVGYIELEDAETGEQMLVDTSDATFRETYARLVSSREADMHRMLRSNGIDLVDITAGQGWVKPLAQFFEQRERRRLR